MNFDFSGKSCMISCSSPSTVPPAISVIRLAANFSAYVVISGPIPLSVAKHYLNDIRETDVDTLILGCTHYPLLATNISKTLGPSIKLIDSSLATADKVKSMLKNKNGKKVNS